MSTITDCSTVDDIRDMVNSSIQALSQSRSSSGSFERISREVSSDEDDDIVYLRSSVESLPREDESYVVVKGKNSNVDELTNSLLQTSISSSVSGSTSGLAISKIWSDQVTGQDRSTPRPSTTFNASSISVSKAVHEPTIIDVVNQAKPPVPSSATNRKKIEGTPASVSSNVKKWRPTKSPVEKKNAVEPDPVSTKIVVATRAYPSPANTPVPAIKQFNLFVMKKTVQTISPPPLPLAQKKAKTKATQAVQNSQQTRDKAQIKSNATVVSNEKTSNAGFGKVVDDMSEVGDGHVDKVGLLSNAYEEAVEFMNSFILEPGQYTSKASKLTLLQALILELGICHENVALPNTLTSAKAVLKSHAFVNIGEYLRVRSQGLEALRGIMHGSRSSLVRELKKAKKGKVKLSLVKETGLTVLLVSCYQ